MPRSDADKTQWQRAETLGALVNGVFLVALCLSIFLEAIQRFVEPQEVSNPKLVAIVGACGLASNILGIFLFHHHDHSHGADAHHAHGRPDASSVAEEGQARRVESPSSMSHQDRAADVSSPARPSNTKTASTEGLSRPSEHSATPSRLIETPNKSRSRSRGWSSLDHIYVHPASFRNVIIAASRPAQDESAVGDTESAVLSTNQGSSETSPLLRQSNGQGRDQSGQQYSHADHKHNQPQQGPKKGGHSHGDLNMRGVFLHVLGDALGNLGVIASALIIWLTHVPWRFYADPLISLIITAIILWSAVPLCKAASRILLQAVPVGMSIDDIKDDIADLPGVLSCHHLHVWQLSDMQSVASLHVQLAFDFEGAGSARYMELARQMRSCLHEYGIHSSTIQPEFCIDHSHSHSHSAAGSGNGSSDEDGHDDPRDGVDGPTASRSRARRQPEGCLLECGDDCDNRKVCCAGQQVGCQFDGQ